MMLCASSPEKVKRDDGDGERAVLDPGFQRHGAGVARVQFQARAKP
jgi:hypothetical protein